MLAAGLRIWGAWAMRCLTEPDPAVVALMARHMAALKEFPVFFYGQAYMGSLEPMASALMVRVLGATGFAVNLGPVLFAVAALAVLWRWARDAGGPWGGLAAVLAGLTGPAVFFQFQMAPRGGYMVALFVETLALWTAARMAARLRAGEAVGGGRFLGLGLLAGIGLWSNLIVAPALAVSALLLAYGMRWRFLRHGTALAAGVLGTAAGLLPWLAYNARHGWASLDMSQVGAREPMQRALQHSWSRFLLLQGDGGAAGGEWGPLLLAGGGLVLAGWGAWVAWGHRREASRRENLMRAAGVLFVVLFAWVFVTSGFAPAPTARYWVPVVPGLALLAAVSCGGAGRRSRRIAAWSLLGLLAAAQGWKALAAVRPHGQRAAACQAAYREIDAALESIGADALLAPLQLFALNVAIDERIPVSNGRQAFYEPILWAAELAEHPAYASDFNGIEAFLRQRGARWESVAAGGRHLLWNLRFPGEGGRFVPRTAGVVMDGKSGDSLVMLDDGNVDTWWAPGVREDAVCEWMLEEPRTIQSVQFLFAHGMADPAFEFPRRLELEARVNGAWVPVLVDAPIVPLEESGGHVYAPGGLARLEFRVGREEVEGLRATFPGGGGRAGRVDWRLAEAGLIEPNGESAAAGGAPDLEEAWREIRSHGPAAHIHAPRRLSNQLLGRGGVERERLPGLSERVFGTPDGLPRAGAVVPEREAVFVTEPRYAAVTRSTLEQHAQAHQETATGDWVIFGVAAGDWHSMGLGLPPAVQWTGDALLTGHTMPRVAAVLQVLKLGGGSPEEQRALLGEVVRWRSSALSALPEETVRALGGDEAVEMRRETVPAAGQSCRTEFANGLNLEGVEILPARPAAGGSVAVKLYWSARETFAPGPELVFIHLRTADGQIAAQDDYRGSPLLWGEERVRPVPGEMMVEERWLNLPAELKPVALDLCVGLYSPRNGRRVRIQRSEAPEIRRRAAVWPGLVRGSASLDGTLR